MSAAIPGGFGFHCAAMVDAFVCDPLALDDRDLVYAVNHHILHLIGDAFNDSDRKRAILGRLSPGQRMVYFTFLVDIEVPNGGFNQYFWNASGQFAFEVVEGYGLIGARRYVEIMKAAIAQFLAEQPEMARFYQQGTLQAFSESYRSTKLGDVDRCYFDAEREEPIDQIRAAFIRRYPGQFDLNVLEACCFSIEACILMKHRRPTEES